MKIHLLKPFRHWSTGHAFQDVPANQARALIARGLAEEVKPSMREVIDSPSYMREVGDAPLDMCKEPVALLKKKRGMRAREDYVTK